MDHLPSLAGRISQAMTLLCGEKPPHNLLLDWMAGDESHVETGADNLQDWAAQHAKLPWMMGITIIEAAEALAWEPDENLISRIEQQHEAEHGRPPTYGWWEN